MHSREQVLMKMRLQVFAMILFSWVFIIAFRLTYLMVPVTVRTVSAHFGVRAVQVLIVAVVIALGFIAFAYKQSNQLFYGLVEIGFGTCSAFTLAFSCLPSDLRLSQWSSFVGCMYVIARGASNVAEGSEDPRYKDFPLVAAVLHLRPRTKVPGDCGAAAMLDTLPSRRN